MQETQILISFILIGYDFSNEQKCKSSYWYVLQQFGRFSGEEGSKDFSYESWKSHR